MVPPLSQRLDFGRQDFVSGKFTGIIMAALAFPGIINFSRAVEQDVRYDTSIEKARLKRLEEACLELCTPAEVKLRFFSDLQGLRTIEGDISCEVILRCQRCGEPFRCRLESHFCSTCDEEKAKSLRISDRLDLVELEENGDFRLLDYLEDCLLLEVPYIPVHPENSADCKVSGNNWSFGQLDSAATRKPFAALASLKEQLAEKNRKNGQPE